MKFIWARIGERKKLHLIQEDGWLLCGCAIFISQDAKEVTRPSIKECCKSCLKMIEGFRNMYHPVYKPSYDWGLKAGETKAIKNIYGSIIRPGEVVIAYDYCMYCKGNMPVVQREGLGKVCARCNATWK